ncbi:hypothetical protein [Egicoccus sp. AB-alg6-2]|uniref:hypothetical protein n=1 Tax=Egicoccus sp. AB-alg6-2 TaxID=3242692 RepID=UPI00359CE242
MRRRPAPLAALLAVLLLAAACSGSPDAAPTPTADETERELAIAVASFDLAVGEDQRLLAGIYTSERQLLGFGEVTFDLGFLGEEPGGEAELTERVQAGFLPVPGAEPGGGGTQPTVLMGQEGAGVYAAQVPLDEAGFWGLRVTAELDDGTVRQGQTTFEVLPEPLVPAVGDEAPVTRNLTLADVEAGTAAPASLDSRALDGGEVPAHRLHQTTIADAIEQGRPVVAVFATPVFCVSRFCGPLAETIEELATRYDNRADFVMVEVWEDFEDQQLNAAAAEWIQTETGGNEPWVFLVGEDGRIAARWDNVLDVAELEAELEALPAIPPRAEGSPAEELSED